jgi:hypothetical protein
MSNYYENQTTIDNALRTICNLCEENSKIRADLEAMKRVHEDTMHIIGTLNEEIAVKKCQISDLNYELDVLSQDHEGYDDEDYDDEDESLDPYDHEDECRSVAARSVMIDPPSGWKYGFPKVMRPSEESPFATFAANFNEKVNWWLYGAGYPIHEIMVWVPKDKQVPNMNLFDILAHAEVPYKASPASGNQS